MSSAKLSTAAPVEPKYPPVDYSAGPKKPPAPKQEPEVQPLGLVLLRNFWTATKGTLTVDVKRPTVPRQVGAGGTLLTYRKEPQHTAAPTRPGGGQFVAQPPPPARAREYREPAVVAFMNTGARVKLMRHLELGPEFEGVSSTGATKTYPALDIGAGLTFELDTAELQPQARVKLWDAISLRALPRPALKISKRLALPRSEGSGGGGGGERAGWGLRLSYECPLGELERFWEPGAARLMVSVDNLGSNGLRLTQTGVEFSGSAVFADGNITIRGAGHMDFPHQLPVMEGEPIVRYELRRLGFKARW